MSALYNNSTFPSNSLFSPAIALYNKFLQVKCAPNGSYSTFSTYMIPYGQ